MHIFYYYPESRTEKQKGIVELIYGSDVQLVAEKIWENSNLLQKGDFLIFNSIDDLLEGVSVEANPDMFVKEYMKIFSKGVELMFDKSTQCNSVFVKTISDSEQNFETVLSRCIMNYALQHSISAKYSKQHVITATALGKRVGLKKGTHLVTKKSIKMKDKIIEFSRDFNGDKTDNELLEILGISRSTYYKYKKELKGEWKNGTDKQTA